MPFLVFLGVAPLVVVAIWYESFRATQIIRQDAQENMALKAKVLADSVSRWEEMQVLALRNLSRQPDIVSMNAQQQKPVLTGMVKTYEHLYLASTTNLNGWNVARSDGKKPKYYGDRSWFLGAKAGNEITSETLISRTTKKPGFCLSTPIRREKLETLGVAMLCTDLKVLAEQVGAIRFGQSSYAFVVDNLGQILVHPDAKFLSGERLTNLTDISTYAPFKTILSDSSGHFSFTDEQGFKWLSYGTRLDDGWGIFIVQQEAEVLQTEQEFRNLGMAIASVAVLGAGALTWFLADRLIRPIDRLTRAVTGIADGQLNQRVQIQRQDELGILAQSFNQMSAQLQKSFEVKTAMEETLGDRATAIALTAAGRKRGKNLVADLGLTGEGDSLPWDQVASGFNQALGKDGTRLCFVDKIEQMGDVIKVYATETVSSAGELQGSEYQCTYTLGTVWGALEQFLGKRLHGKHSESVLQSGDHDVFEFTEMRLG